MERPGGVDPRGVSLSPHLCHRSQGISCKHNPSALMVKEVPRPLEEEGILQSETVNGTAPRGSG